MPRFDLGDYVKVEFKDELEPLGEWMWVPVEFSDDVQRLVPGVLDDVPVLELGVNAGLGTKLAVSYDKIRDHKKPWEFYAPDGGERYDVVLINPPFGTKGANQAPDRDDVTIETSNNS